MAMTSAGKWLSQKLGQMQIVDLVLTLLAATKASVIEEPEFWPRAEEGISHR